MKTEKLNTRDMTTIAIIAVLYVVLTLGVPGISYGPVQFRISELLNFVIIPKRKYAFGVVLGVIISNFFSPFALDIFFGTLHTTVAFLASTLLFRLVKQHVWQYVIVIVSFTFFIWIIALELVLLDNNSELFWQLYGTLALSEFVVLCIGAPIMYSVEQQLTKYKIFSNK